MLNQREDYSEYMDKEMELNTVIFMNHGIEFGSKQLENKLNLTVEISELLNITRVHKYWTTKGMEPKEILLEEYVDIWSMALNVGNDINIPGEHYGIEKKESLAKQFDALFFTAQSAYSPMGWHCFISQLKGLGIMLNFKSEEVKDAFIKKWEVNIKRQKDGY